MVDLLWIVPEKNGGIATYSEALWPEIKMGSEKNGLVVEEPLRTITESVGVIRKVRPKLIHVQHEYSLMGSKVPPLYFFPKWVKQIKKAMPDVKIVATAHTVLADDYEYPWKGRGWQIPFRFIANKTLMPVLKPVWNSKTWGRLDGVIVHSATQVKTIENTDCKNVRMIPHFVHAIQSAKESHPVFQKIPKDVPIILVFGFITPEKGQDIAIRAFAKLKTKAHLVIAGGLRRQQDASYLKKCENLISELGVQNSVSITGVLSHLMIGQFYERSAVVLAPFRETTGSGTLSMAFGHGATILASDLPLNAELSGRVDGCVDYFKSENAEDCAKKLEILLNDTALQIKLSNRSKEYAEKYSIEKTAKEHISFYKNLLN
jgi:glycosyltransferase involved in cell wall biosynthesis